VIDKILEFPVEKVFPSLDLFRIFLCHNSAASLFNASDAGASYIGLLLSLLDKPNAPKAVTMLSIRCLCNLSKSMAGQAVFTKRRIDIMDKARKHLSHPDKNTRQAAITLYLNYSILFNNKEDQEGRA
jgi:hypothetical protein